MTLKSRSDKEDIDFATLRESISAAFKNTGQLVSDTLLTAFEFYTNGNTVGRSARQQEEVKNWQRINNTYIAAYWKGLVYLPGESLAFYLPRLIVYLIDMASNGDEIDELLEQLLFCLDSVIPRGGGSTDIFSLTSDQNSALNCFLDAVSALTEDVLLLRLRDKVQAKLDSKEVGTDQPTPPKNE